MASPFNAPLPQILAGLAAACGAPPDDLARGARIEVGIASVIDGDTLVVAAPPGVQTPDRRPMDGERIRLLGVDTPELARSGRPSECYAERARDFVASAVAGRAIALELDPTRCRPPREVRGCRGDYGRLLAYVHAGGRVLNETLLSTGHARVLRGPDRFRHRDSARYERLEADAIAARVGVWSCP